MSPTRALSGPFCHARDTLQRACWLILTDPLRAWKQCRVLIKAMLWSHRGADRSNENAAIFEEGAWPKPRRCDTELLERMRLEVLQEGLPLDVLLKGLMDDEQAGLQP